jgi:hypothetical protein
LNITSTSPLSGGSVGTPYSVTLNSTGGAAPITWSITSGTLPAGLCLSASTGQISGTPTVGGIANFTVQAADSETPAMTAHRGIHRFLQHWERGFADRNLRVPAAGL